MAVVSCEYVATTVTSDLIQQLEEDITTEEALHQLEARSVCILLTGELQS